ncbi:MAG: decaprenyl-phosphate phosphoribosyltransferase [Phycisphaerales bacterium]
MPTAEAAHAPAATPPERPGSAGGPSRWASLIRLARPHQWAKNAFVVVGPIYAIATGGGHLFTWSTALAVVGAVLAFGFASSACYIVNDIRDVDEDRAHPRKRRRPIAAGHISVATAKTWAAALFGLSGLSILLAALPDPGPRAALSAAGWLAAAVAVYILNTTLYSLYLKRATVIDVISLASGFVLRVLGGCAAAGVAPSAWLLDVVFFISMFLAFGKRLGERRTMGEDAASGRRVLHHYTDELLRMAVVVTGVATLVTYSGYVQDRGEHYQRGFNLLWLTMLPATYGLLRCIVLLERGVYDDPTELAAKDRPFQLSVAIFMAVTLAVMMLVGPALPQSP